NGDVRRAAGLRVDDDLLLEGIGAGEGNGRTRGLGEISDHRLEYFLLLAKPVAEDGKVLAREVILGGKVLVALPAEAAVLARREFQVLRKGGAAGKHQ